VSRKPLADICEDRGIEHYAFLQSLMNGERVYPRLVKHFRDATDGSQLTADSLRLDSDSGPSAVSRWLLALVIGSLYYPDCPYEFSVLPADIPGQVYEQFLGKVTRLTAGHQAEVEHNSEGPSAIRTFDTSGPNATMWRWNPDADPPRRVCAHQWT
jgi:hypothetical protein